MFRRALLSAILTCLVAASAWAQGYGFSGRSGSGSGSGSVTSVTCGAGLSGGTITTSGTCLVPGGGITNSMLAGSIAASKLVGTDIATVGALSAGSIASGFGAIVTTNPITGTAVKGSSLIDTGITSGDLMLSGGATALTGLAEVDGDCVLGAGGAWTAGSCGSGSLTVTDGTHSVASTSTITVGNGFLVGGSAGSATLNLSTTLNTQSGTGAYAIASTDAAKLVLRTNASGGADTITAASGAGFTAGYSTTYATGSFAGNTITPASGLINGLSVLKLGSYQYSGIDSDGTNYHAALGVPQPATQAGTTYLRDDMTWVGGQAFLSVAQSWTAPQRGNTETPAISSTTFTPVFSTGQNHRIVFPATTCVCTIANPATIVAGQSGIFELVQGATSASLNPTWGSEYVYSGGTSTIVLNTGLGSVTYIPYYVDSTATYILLGTAEIAVH